MSMREGGAPDSERLARLIAVSRRLAAETNLQPVLRYLLESAVALTGAERGFLLVRREGELSCAAAVPDLEAVPGPVPPELSRTVLAKALEGESVLSTDLAADARFRARLSVRKLRLRSVLAVPLPCRTGMAGILYLDSRVSRTLFRQGDLDLLVAFAAQGSLALENVFLLSHDAAGERRSAWNGASEASGRPKPVPAPRVALTAAWPAVGHPEESSDRRAPGAARSAGSEAPARGETIVGSSAAISRILELVAKVAPSELPVLIVGESGTGKELLARAIHDASARSTGRFVAENCAAIPESLIESELFGSIRGAFTGADRDREGLFRAADGGTLFLDEIGEMPPSLQARLLRALQEREVRPVGSPRSVPVNVRIVAATNRDPNPLDARRLRIDLYYRLAGVTIEVPPLRERREDIPALAAHFLQTSARASGTTALRLSPEALLRLAAYDWPGNVRELENEIERAAVLTQGLSIEADDLSSRVQGSAVPTSAGGPRTAERTMIEAALLGQHGNVTGAARAIGWSRQKLYRRMGRLSVPHRYGHDGTDGDVGRPR